MKESDCSTSPSRKSRLNPRRLGRGTAGRLVQETSIPHILKHAARISSCKRATAGAIVFALALAIAAGADGAEGYRWRSVTEGQVKIDDKVPLTWNLYQPDKKKDVHLVLILLGHRWLMLDVKAKLVYQVTPGELQAQGKDYDSDDLAKSEALIPSSDWADRDVGPAEDIHVTLGDYGRVLEVELPHLMDLRRGIR
jgi:hypothetical protein